MIRGTVLMALCVTVISATYDVYEQQSYMGKKCSLEFLSSVLISQHWRVAVLSFYIVCISDLHRPRGCAECHHSPGGSTAPSAGGNAAVTVLL